MKKIGSKRSDENCVFCQIVGGHRKEDFAYEDRNFIVLKDKKPRAPFHFLVVTKEHYQDISDLMIRNPALLKDVGLVVKSLVNKFTINGGYTWGFHAGGKQTVNHVHAQLLAGMGVDDLVL